MSSLGRLLCSLPVLVASLWAVGPACAGPVKPHEPIVGEVRIADELLIPAPNDDTAWVAAAQGADPLPGLSDASFSGALPMTSLPPPLRTAEPPIIAAPLPPALLSGLIGLAGVYIYRRRHRLR